MSDGMCSELKRGIYGKNSSNVNENRFVSSQVQDTGHRKKAIEASGFKKK
jgi:hypothetical protein